jgi:hypothetical protein
MPVATAARPNVRRHHEQFKISEMLAMPHFYILYAMMLMIGGLMVTAQSEEDHRHGGHKPNLAEPPPENPA